MNVVYNEDCMIGMARYPDKYFDLAIVDPPYGIDINKSGRLVREKGWEYKDWDSEIPPDSFFKELMRVSSSQIIWGGNYFPLPPTKCYLIWDKQQPAGVSFADSEFAWASFDSVAKTFRRRPQGDLRIHPTQKPISLYDWLIVNYAKGCKTILDTHVGSGSSRIAAAKAGLDFIGFEIDKEYWQAQENRFINFSKQQTLFAPTAEIVTEGVSLFDDQND